MMSAATIQPYIDLITWQVVAIVGGLVFGPAVYVMAFRMRTLSVLGATADLSREEAKAIEAEAEQTVQERVDAGAAGGEEEDAHEELEDIANAPAADREQMYKNVVEAQLALSAIVRGIASPLGGERNLRAFKKNLEIVRGAKALPRPEIDRLASLYERRLQFRRDPSTLTRDAYKSYMRSARRTANRLPKKTRNFASPSISEQSSLPN